MEQGCRKAPDGPPGAEEMRNVRGRLRLRWSRSSILMVLCALLLFVVAFCVCSFVSYVFLPCVPKSGAVSVQLSIEELSLCPKRFAVVRLENLAGCTLWYQGCRQYPNYLVEYLVDGVWRQGNGPLANQRIPLRDGEAFLFITPLDWDRFVKAPEAVRVGIAVYRKRSASTDDFDWFWSAPKRLD